jgi:regulator of protease activity HflC (stomatin/prohibitin superfamily)
MFIIQNALSVGGALLFLLLIIILPSIHKIGPTEVGLITKRFSLKKLTEDNPLAFNGEAGYQADLLMPGLRWKFWIVYRVDKFPWVQVPAGEIGVVIAQIGKSLPIGAKSARYSPRLGNFTNVRQFVDNDGEKGVQRPVLPPGTLAPFHPVGFIVLTKNQVYGLPVSPELQKKAGREGRLMPLSFGLASERLEVVRIAPQQGKAGEILDMIGIITTFEGEPLPSGDIASRLGRFKDAEEAEAAGKPDAEIMEMLLGSKNYLHNNYQDFQKFLDEGGKIGLQHDPLLYGMFNLNPFLVSVEMVPMLLVKQGEVAVIKSYVGLVTQDTSGVQFKYGSLVIPGHRGIWREPLRTGKYPLNPRCYQAEVVPTAILTLNWADTVSEAHNLDRQLSQITAKSCEGFVFHIDLQVQIHVPDTKAPRVISMVGTMQNLVNEVLQAAVGNHFRDKLQSMPAVLFIQTRQKVQQEAFNHIKVQLDDYDVETKGVYIQDVVLPETLVNVLTEREIAAQEVATFKRQQEAQEQRIQTEQARGTADMQHDLAHSAVNVEIERNNANALKAKADGEAAYIRQTGAAKGAEVEAVGLAKATAYKAQVEALGREATAAVNIVTALSDGKGAQRIVPEVLVVGGDGGAIQGLAGTLIKKFASPGGKVTPAT